MITVIAKLQITEGKMDEDAYQIIKA